MSLSFTERRTVRRAVSRRPARARPVSTRKIKVFCGLFPLHPWCDKIVAPPPCPAGSEPCGTLPSGKVACCPTGYRPASALRNPRAVKPKTFGEKLTYGLMQLRHDTAEVLGDAFPSLRAQRPPVDDLYRGPDACMRLNTPFADTPMRLGDCVWVEGTGWFYDPVGVMS